MSQSLKAAITATKEENWSLAYQYLQQLLAEKNPALGPEILDLAFRVFEQADFRQRWDIAKLLPKLGEKAIKPLQEIVEDEDEDLEYRWFAGRVLGEFAHPEAITTLVKLLKTTEDEELAAIAANALANLGPSAIAILTPLLQENPSRRLATQGLAQIRHLDVIPPLLSVVRDEDVTIRKTALEALNNYHDPCILPVLVQALADYSASVRKEAVIGLGMRSQSLGESDLLTYLEPRLYDLDLEVCQQAAIALKRLGTPEAAKALYKLLSSSLTPIPLQITLIQALGWMETPTALNYLEQALTEVPSESLIEIIRVLGRIETEELKPLAAQILLDFFLSSHSHLETPAIRQTLAYTWGQLKHPSTISVLEQLQQDPDHRVRIHATSALKQCLGRSDY